MSKLMTVLIAAMFAATTVYAADVAKVEAKKDEKAAKVEVKKEEAKK